MPHTYHYARPALTVDCVVFGLDDDELKVMLIQRDQPPFEGKWALPGGCVRLEETLDEAARRELEEETGVTKVSAARTPYFIWVRGGTSWGAMSNASEWAGHVSAWQTSGESARDYCEKRGLKLNALRYWSGRIRREQEQSENDRGSSLAGSVRMAKVRTGSSAEGRMDRDRSPSGGSGIAVAIGSFRLEVERSFDEETLGRVVRVLLKHGGAR